MTGMLASVNSLEEATTVLSAHVDIIDLKQPALGALGALDTSLVKTIVTKINGRRPVSATIGDLPVLPETVCNAVVAMAGTGVDYIKIGLFPGGDWQETLEKLAALAQDLALIAVLFADSQPDFNSINTLKAAGFKGVMLDTLDKTNGSLTQVMAHTKVAQFVRLAKSHQLLCGLAGSLRLEDIEALLPHQPDYLGFRGALCVQHDRTAQLDRHAVMKIKQALVN